MISVRWGSIKSGEPNKSDDYNRLTQPTIYYNIPKDNEVDTPFAIFKTLKKSSDKMKS